MTLALSIKNLKKTYKGGFTALKGINLDVEEGDFFALLGPNGAGKSTTIGIMTSLINKTSGDVSIMGHDLSKDMTLAKKQIGLVPQEFNFNIFEPVEEIIVNQAGYYGISRKDAFVAAETQLKRLGLWDKRKVQARELSGGMKRRMMIARALVHKPRLLILDEPTAGVDIEIRHSMWEFLKEINDEGTTIILTTHYLEEAENLCRNIAIINHGNIIENTSMKSLLNTLHTFTYVLDLKENIEKLPEFKDFHATLNDPHTLEVVIDVDKPMNIIFEQLSQHGIQVNSSRMKHNRLEELFMQLINEKELQS